MLAYGIKKKKKLSKIGAIGIRVKKWIAYHGFSINISNNLKPYNKIVPCGIKNRSVTNLVTIKKKNYKNIDKLLILKLIKNLKN